MNNRLWWALYLAAKRAPIAPQRDLALGDVEGTAKTVPEHFSECIESPEQPKESANG